MTDVVVIGAGLSGLVCARDLARRGASVRVLEARDRVGGRLLSVPLGGRRVDVGGQWMSAGQPRLAALAAELGVDTVPQHRDGRAVIARPGAGGGLRAAIDGWWRVRALEKLIARARPDDPLATPNAAALDRDSVADWLERHGGRSETRETIELITELEFAAAPDELSLLYFLVTLAGRGGLGGRDTRELRFAGGAQALAEKLSVELGDRVTLGAAVRAVEQDDGVVVARADSTSVRARRCVLALPPALCAEIEVAGITAERRAVEGGMPPGRVMKCIACYPRAFWRERGLSGEAYQIGGRLRAVVDLCDPDGGRPTLLAFAVGSAATELAELPASEQHAAVLAELGAIFGEDAADASDLLIHDWGTDPWSRGCVGNLVPGVLGRAASALRAPCGRTHFAGSETAIRWPRTMEGAIEAGERAAGEVAAAIFP